MTIYANAHVQYHPITRFSLSVKTSKMSYIEPDVILFYMVRYMVIVYKLGVT